MSYNDDYHQKNKKNQYIFLSLYILTQRKISIHKKIHRKVVFVFSCSYKVGSVFDKSRSAHNLKSPSA
jgi:hypothetical protein